MFRNLRKCGILLASIGTEAATEICKQLPREVVRELAEAAASLGPVTSEEQAAVLNEFVNASPGIMSLGGTDYARSLTAQVIPGAAFCVQVQQLVRFIFIVHINEIAFIRTDFAISHLFFKWSTFPQWSTTN